MLARIASYAVAVAVFASAELAAQDVECHGQNFTPPPGEAEVTVDFARVNDVWTATHSTRRAT